MSGMPCPPLQTVYFHDNDRTVPVTFSGTLIGHYRGDDPVDRSTFVLQLYWLEDRSCILYGQSESHPWECDCQRFTDLVSCLAWLCTDKQSCRRFFGAWRNRFVEIVAE